MDEEHQLSYHELTSRHPTKNRHSEYDRLPTLSAELAYGSYRRQGSWPQQDGDTMSKHASSPSGGGYSNASSCCSSLGFTIPTSKSEREHELEAQVLRLMSVNSHLEARLDETWTAYRLLACGAPTTNSQGTSEWLQKLMPTASGPAPDKLEQKEYPKVRFWDLPAWRVFLKQKASTTGSDTPIANHYLEDQHGVPVSNLRGDAIQAAATSIWHGFHELGRAPGVWGLCPQELKDFFYAEMARKFNEMRYCDNNWKAQNVATSTYSGWHGKHVAKKVCGIKQEIKEEVVIDKEADEVSGPSKRCFKVNSDIVAAGDIVEEPLKKRRKKKATVVNALPGVLPSITPTAPNLEALTAPQPNLAPKPRALVIQSGLFPSNAKKTKPSSSSIAEALSQPQANSNGGVTAVDSSKVVALATGKPLSTIAPPTPNGQQAPLKVVSQIASSPGVATATTSN
ncbi:hypothetical protein B0H34DRAFT_801735 [Crassisporium funariophilum]|nr:hypothetical protein B0H34DRAFT_801735 [Crassisporium funariophilum]